MMLARKDRPSSENGSRGPPAHQEKWTKMVFRGDEILDEGDSGVEPAMMLKKKVHLQERHVVFSIPLTTDLGSSRNSDISLSESKQNSKDEIEAPIVDTEIKPQQPVVEHEVKEFRQESRQRVSLKREKLENLRTVPSIATIAELGPKILNNPMLCPPTQAGNNRRHSSTALPDWWKPRKDEGPGMDTPAKPPAPVMLHEAKVKESSQKVLLKREQVEELRTIPPIATIAALGPKIWKNPKLCHPPPASSKRRNSSTALPDWWQPKHDRAAVVEAHVKPPAPVALHEGKENGQKVVLKREKVEDLSTIPQIATIAVLGPKLLNNPKLCRPPPASRERRPSNTALPDWWHPKKNKAAVAHSHSKPQAAQQVLHEGKENRQESCQKVPLKRTHVEPKPTPPVVLQAVEEIRQKPHQECLPKREKMENLCTIPQIATIADLGPKILNNPKLCRPPQSSSKRRLSSTALPDWWQPKNDKAPVVDVPVKRQSTVVLPAVEKICQEPQQKRKGSLKRDALCTVPPIATIAELGPKILNNPKLCRPPPGSDKRRRSSTALPDWWKQGTDRDQDERICGATGHITPSLRTVVSEVSTKLIDEQPEKSKMSDPKADLKTVVSEVSTKLIDEQPEKSKSDETAMSDPKADLEGLAMEMKNDKAVEAFKPRYLLEVFAVRAAWSSSLASTLSTLLTFEWQTILSALLLVTAIGIRWIG